MKVYTKKGDEGQTGLIGGTRIFKDDIRIRAYGEVDELNSWIGVIRSYDIISSEIDFLISVQNNLFTIGSHLANDADKSRMKLPEIHESDVEAIENEIDKLETSLEPMKNFVLPGGDELTGFIHVARCVCRRAERAVVTLHQANSVQEIILKYLNRLSDYLFVLSRTAQKRHGSTEIPWTTR
jgi:cob(I)alamin adenosyltransferase